MTSNDLLRRLRYALNLNGESIAGLCSMGGHDIKPVEVLKLLKKEEEQGFVVCDDLVLGAFFDGLIISRRGPHEQNDPGKEASRALDNNLILRKLRIALELNDEAMRAILAQAGVHISKSELSAMFRAKGHKNYQKCGDQFLRNFIRGLTLAPDLPGRTGQDKPQKGTTP